MYIANIFASGWGENVSVNTYEYIFYNIQIQCRSVFPTSGDDK